MMSPAQIWTVSALQTLAIVIGILVNNYKMRRLIAHIDEINDELRRMTETNQK